MQSDGESGVELEAQLAIKERELKELQATRMRQLESSLKRSQAECSILREQNQQVQEIYQVNLAVLDERNRELEKYDIITSRAVAVEQKRQEELEQLRARIANLEAQRVREAEERKKEQSESLKSAAQHQFQLDKIKSTMEDELQQRTVEYDRMTMDLQCKIRELEGEMILQRQEMMATFDTELKQREHELNLKSDEMCAVMLSQNVKVNMLSSEAEVHHQAQLQVTAALKASEELCQRLQTQLQHREQEVEEITAVKEQRIKELMDEVKQMKTKLKKTSEEHMKKYKNLVQVLKECDARLEAHCQAFKKQLQRAEKRIAKLQERVGVLVAQLHSIQKEQRKALEQKDKTIQKLCSEAERIRTKWDGYASHASTEMVTKDEKILALQDRESKLRAELERRREEIERYKQQLCDGLKREQILEQKKVQVDLEWQNLCEDMKTKLCFSNETMIRELTQARDLASAELKDKEQELQDVKVLLQSVKSERDQAVQGLAPKTDSLASEQIGCLQEQNSVLRAVIIEMRKEMEGLSHPAARSQAQPQPSCAQPDQHSGSPAATSITTAADAQMATKLSPQPDDVSSKTSLAGNCTKDSLAMKQQSHVVSNISEKNALVHLLQDENTFLREQLALGLFENVRSTKGGRDPCLQRRLKQAASCIVRLSREKQHLIEIGNRLRACNTTPGVQGTIMAARALDPAEQQKDSPTEKQGEQRGRLSALEQLQYQLTTEELQYALRPTLCTTTDQPFPRISNQGPTSNTIANPWNHCGNTSGGFKNKENSPLLSQSQWSVDVGLTQSQTPLDVGPQPHSGPPKLQFSSLESLQSLKELWATLDHAKSPTMLSEGNGDFSTREVAESGGAAVQIAVHGISAPIHGQAPAEVWQRKNSGITPSNTAKTSRPGASGKIRNYNVKD